MANEEYRPPKGRVIPKSRAVFQIVLRGKAATSPRQVLPDRPGGERARRRQKSLSRRRERTVPGPRLWPMRGPPEVIASSC